MAGCQIYEAAINLQANIKVRSSNWIVVLPAGDMLIQPSSPDIRQSSDGVRWLHTPCPRYRNLFIAAFKWQLGSLSIYCYGKKKEKQRITYDHPNYRY
jgi:hypothetical protein